MKRVGRMSPAELLAVKDTIPVAEFAVHLDRMELTQDFMMSQTFAELLAALVSRAAGTEATVDDQEDHGSGSVRVEVTVGPVTTGFSFVMYIAPHNIDVSMFLYDDHYPNDNVSFADLPRIVEEYRVIYATADEGWS